MANEMSERIPKVSILVPAYNCVRYIDETLASIAAQTFGDFEVIIADNASTDGLAEVVKPWIETGPCFRYVCHASNLGMVGHIHMLTAQSKTICQG